MQLDDIYTEEIKKCIYASKAKLPPDFPLVTVDREIFIVIRVYMEHFAWRSVEDRLAIAIELENLKQEIERNGVGCLIEKATLDEDETDETELFT